jgi:pimeloyl-ACP methyl ester carboxylesterase
MTGMMLEPTSAEPGTPIRHYAVRGGGGVTLRAREWGNPEGPGILFIHGWSQCDLCWSSQVVGDLAEQFRLVTFDNRGHGASDKPEDADSYCHGRLWADDVAAVIEATRLETPVVVAWSYGGFIVSDYIRVHGEGNLAGIDLVGAAVVRRPPPFNDFGPGLVDNVQDACAPDPAANIDAIRRFVRACTAQPLRDDVWTAALCWNMLVPAEIRSALITRQIDDDGVLAKLSIPVLVTHGLRDRIVLPSMAEHALAVCPTATASWYEGVGHMPFVENAGRFNRELAEFADGAQS